MFFGKKSGKKCEKHAQERVSTLTTLERQAKYAQTGREAWNRAWQILNTKDGWRDSTGIDIKSGRVHHQNFPDVGRVFKLEGLVDLSPERLFEEVVVKVEDNPRWNPTVLHSTIVESVDDNTDICHNVTADAAGGLVASRDFVSVRHWQTQDDVILSAGVGVHHPDCPPSKRYVRGHNKPGGWFFAPSETGPDTCAFGWLMCTDLKGWLPQTLIDQAVPAMMLDFLKYLQKHVAHAPAD